MRWDGSHGSEADLPAQDVDEHHPVTGQAVERVPEGRGTVLLEDVVPDPCAAVAAQRRTGQPPRVARGDRDDDGRDHEQRTDEMQPATATIAVLTQIERVELTEARESRIHRSALRQRDELLVVAGDQ